MGWGDRARAQAEALLPAKAGEASGRWAGSSCLLFLLGCCEVSQGRKGSQPACGDYAVPHPGSPRPRNQGPQGSEGKGPRQESPVSGEPKVIQEATVLELDLWGWRQGSGTFSSGSSNTVVLLPILNLKYHLFLTLPFFFFLVVLCILWDLGFLTMD